MLVHHVVRYWRKQLGLTQAQLGEKLEVTQSTISHWESPGREDDPPMRALRRLAELAGVTVPELLSVSGSDEAA